MATAKPMILRLRPLALTCAVLIPLAVIFYALSLTRQREDAERATEEFHRHFSAGQDDAIYDAADPAYKGSLSRESNRSFLSRIRRKMGDCRDSQATRWFVNSTTNGTFVTLRYAVKCSSGDLQEEFVWRILRGRAVLVRYKVDGAALLVD